jgi:hypothetical protein
MAINPPVTHTVISTQQWGIPITNQVNLNTADIAAMKPTAWTNATLINGWITASGTPQYRKIGDNVQIRGNVGQGSQGSVITNIPAGFRPPFALYLASSSFTGTAWVTAEVMMDSNGALTYHANSPASPAFVSINMFYSTI